jgi:hypothetical protein
LKRYYIFLIGCSGLIVLGSLGSQWIASAVLHHEQVKVQQQSGISPAPAGVPASTATPEPSMFFLTIVCMLFVVCVVLRKELSRHD